MLELSASDIRRIVSTRDALAAAAEAFKFASSREVLDLPRFAVGEKNLLVMTAGHNSLPGILVKVLSLQFGSGRLARTSLSGTVAWFDTDSGEITAVMDAAVITSLRTGGASALATERLTTVNATVLAMIGAGGQAADQVRSVCLVCPITEVRIASLHAPSRERLAGELASQFPDVHFVACKTVRAAVHGADVICTATPSERPLFDLSDIGTQVHINAIGSYRPEMCEIDPAILNAATMVVVDREDSARSGSGEIVRASKLSELELVELGALLNGDIPISELGGITVFKSVGVAAQDWSLARMIVDRAKDEARSQC